MCLNTIISLLTVTTLVHGSILLSNGYDSHNEYENNHHGEVISDLKYLGTFVGHQKLPPKIIKITKTYAVKIPIPYPVKIPHTVPVPIPVPKPYAVPYPYVIHPKESETSHEKNIYSGYSSPNLEGHNIGYYNNGGNNYDASGNGYKIDSNSYRALIYGSHGDQESIQHQPLIHNKQYSNYNTESESDTYTAQSHQ